MQGEEMTLDRAYAQYDIEKKSLLVAYVLWAFLGYVGAHRFYLGRPLSGLVMLALSTIILVLSLVSFGFLSFLWVIVGLWWLVDALLIPGIVAGRNARIADRVLGYRG
ncbi:TM2 domain-containing protein [Devosia sp. CC-YST696]|nr:TM2 domain-containing protein [Devosia faecipullorum]